ncbi:MAG: methyl-accepting chemotaxis protein, partial [Lachnospiraceae bacterium]|nr:methyl-accepting chemotaxis protein [Lachnospiraceae bacterium]
TVLYDLDDTKIASTLESGPIYDVIQAAIPEGVEVTYATKLDIPEHGVANYTDEVTGAKMFGTYTYLPEYGWLLFVAADVSTLYAEASSTATSIILIALIVLAFIVVALTVIIKKMLDPIKTVQLTLTDVANHNLKVGDSVAKYKNKDDEIGKLANATLDVVDMLKTAVGVLRNSSDSLNSSSADLDATSKKLVGVATENMAVTENFSASIQQTTAAVRMVEEEINKIVKLVDDVDQKVKLGETGSEKLINSTKQMNEQANKNINENVETMDQTLIAMNEAMQSLEAVKKINELADAIMDITSQTNLLSLNASIEAARAGEAGRGFAVVADEIGQLAGQSKNTAMNIQEIVEESNCAVDNVKAQVDKLTGYIKNNVTSVFEGFADQSSKYGDGIGDIRSTVDEIGSAMKDLSESINGIAREIAAVTGASEENSEGVNDIILKSEETTKITTDIERLAETSRTDADNLENIVNQFKL